MTSRVVEVGLPNGTIALVQATELVEPEPIAEKVGWKDALDFTHVSGTLEGVTQSIRSGLAKARPERMTVELGIDLAVKNGVLTAMLVDGEASASLRVTLEWGNGQPGGADDT